MRRNNKKIVVTTILGIALLIIGTSYAYLSYNTEQKEKNRVSTNACIQIEMNELTEEGITLEKTYPLTDQEGEKTKPYTFSIKNTCNNTLIYDVNLEVLDIENKMASKNIAAKVDNNEKQVLIEKISTTPTYKEEDYTASESYKIFTGEIKGGETITHDVRVWLDESAGNESQNKSFYSKVTIIASTPKEMLDTAKVLVYREEELLKEIESKEENQEIEIYVESEVSVRLSSYSTSHTYYYTEIENGEQIPITNNEFKIEPSEEGTTRYIYISGSNRYIKLIIYYGETVTPPEITGGSEEYALSRTITLKTPGSASSGVEYYEYYIGTEEQDPGDNVTGTTEGNLEVTQEGTSYVYYRTVSKSGNRSEWSLPEKVNIYYKASSVTYRETTVESELNKLYEKMKKGE